MTFLNFATIIVIGALLYSILMINYSKNILELRQNKVIISVSIILVGLSSVYIALTNIPMVIIYIYLFLIMNSLYYVMFRGKLCTKLFIAGNFVFFLLATRGIVLSLESIWFNKSMYEVIVDSKYYRYSIIVLLIFMILFFKIFSNMYSSKKLARIHEKEIWMLIVAQLIIDTMLITSSFVYYYNEYMVWLNFYHALLCIISFGGFYLLFSYSVYRCDLIEYELKLNLFEKQLKRQLEDYYSQIDYIENLRGFKHDYQKINESLFNLIELGDCKRIKEFVKDMDKAIDNIDINYTKYSNQPLVQAIFFAASKYCSLNDINFEAQVIFPDKTNLTDLDICRVFDNIVKNAIEACLLIEKPNLKNIKISSKIHDFWFTVIAENTFDGNIDIRNGKFLTRKKDREEHGFGTKIISNVIESRNGFVKFNVDRENCIFEISIHIPLDGID